MANKTNSITSAWEEKEGPVVLTTIGANGIPNAIYATCVAQYDENTFIVANNYFLKTLDNIKAGSKASILFMTKDSKAYQLKGSVVYHTNGPVFDNMKTWNPEKHPGHGAAALVVDEAYSGQERLL